MTEERMSGTVRARLSVMMFLQYAMYGIWIIPMGAYLGHLGHLGHPLRLTVWRPLSV